MGRYLAKVEASAPVSIWDTGSEVFRTLLAVQQSFEPASYTSSEYGYSVAHPLDWSRTDSDVYDYRADHRTSLNRVLVQIDPREAFTSMLDYGAAHTVTDGDILSRTLVYSRRPNPSYRIDYTLEGATLSRRGAVLITFSGENAIWVFVSGLSADWADLAPLANDIFFRVAVK